MIEIFRDSENRNIFTEIIKYLDQYDICNLKYITKSETLNKVYAKVKKHCKRAKLIFVSEKIIYCDDRFHYYDKNKDEIENYFISKTFDYDFVYEAYIYHTYGKDKRINSLKNFLNSKISTLKQLNIKKGDIVCFEFLFYDHQDRSNQYIYDGFKFIEMGKFLPTHFVHKKYNLNYWEYALGKYIKLNQTKYIEKLGCCIFS